MRWLLVIGLALASCISFSQDFCGTQYDPAAIEPHHVNFQIPSDRTLGWKTIPCVVHIVYSDSIENSYFSEGYVDSAIAHVNDHYSSASIQFDLLDIDYKNLADYGWHNSILDGTICFPDYGTHNTILANDVSWDEDYYCNIYVIPNMCEPVLGWSYITNYVNNARDGVWVNNNAFGIGAPHLPERNNENKVLIHELGHYCGLHHVFQGVSYCGHNADLHDEEWYQWGDLVQDTPPISSSWYCESGCPSFNSSRPWADYEHNNHMDYYADSCRQIFTEGQIARMHLKLEFQRAGLFGGDPFCFCDLNGDGVVGVSDLLYVMSFYGEHSTEGDVNNDGIVGQKDLAWILQRYGTDCTDGEVGWYQTNAKTESNKHILLKVNQVIKN